MGFNFTEKDLEKEVGGKVFNGGNAGKAKNVKVWMEEAGKNGVEPNTNPDAPRFKVYFEDENGARVNRACFDIKEDDFPGGFNRYKKTYEEVARKEVAYMNKIIEHSGGTKVLEFEDDTSFWRECVKNIGTEKVNIFVNYGSTQAPKEFLEPRKWLPMVESVDTADADSKLTKGRIDNMVRLEPDTQEKAEDTFF